MKILIDSNELDCILITRPSIPSPKRQADMMEIQGRTPLYIDRGYINDIEITVTLAKIVDVAHRQNSIYELKKVLLSSVGKILGFNDNDDWHYRIKAINVDDCTTEGSMYNHLDVTFICDPYQYYNQSVSFGVGTVINEYEECNPVYTIVGEGVCHLTVNGNTVSVNVGGSVTIDTEKRLAYNGSNWLNHRMTGDFDDIKLQNGTNEISVSSGFTLTGIVEWRRL